ncbi:YceI family protein [Flagellimonas sediminis]|uniref:YceI family protein n=1 Tax=Flagellimonas sediminis TaxID=2696468 RepID=A0A6I5KXM3_9FLAO|nr:YceI family protein [Allomuricauda sediminis]NDV44705.1 YceI family protein [Allomuricauda sediminis]
MESQIRKRQFTLQAIFLWITFGLIPLTLAAQNFKLNNGEGKVTVTGTSTLHDWEEVAEQKSGTLVLDASGDLPSVSTLKFVVDVESLKSGHDGMDKNTYKALNTDKHKQITFQMLEVKSISPVVSASKGYKMVALGNLTIAGKTNKVELPFNLTINGDKVELEGKKPLKMTDFGVEPPKALLGTIKTGDEIEVHYNTIWTK